MSLPITRAIWRRQPTSQLPGLIRFESTNSSTTAKASEAAKNTASKAQEAASGFTSKASQGLSRVTSAAGPALSGAASRVGNALGKVGGRTGRLIAFVERQIPPSIYYAKVGMELSKIVFQGRSMTPPPLSTFQSYFQNAVKNVRNPQALFAQASSAMPANPANVLDRVRNMSRAQWVTGGVIAAEVLGFFTVGEIIGRMKLVGYRGEPAGHAHH